MRVCQFRHDGKWTSNRRGSPKLPDQEDLHLYSTDAKPRVKPTRTGAEAKYPYSSFAFIVIFALSTFDTGQPFSAASAYF
jgi:hypothetical protein